jgi:dUTPase
MVLNFTRLDPHTRDPEQIEPGKPVFKVFANEGKTIQPLDRAEVSSGIMMFPSPGLIVKVYPSEHLLLECGMVCLPRLMSSGGEVKLSLINIAIPDFLYLKNESMKAHSALFGSHNSFRIDRGDEMATIVVEKSLENLSLREII